MQNQPQATVPNIVRGQAGWNPRWWLLAAFCCCAAIVIGMLLWTPLICPEHSPQSQAFICGVTSWYSTFQIVLIGLLFWSFWFLISVFGVRFVDVPRPGAHPVRHLLDSLIRFDSLSGMLYIQGGVALLLINLMWWLNNSPTLAFAFFGIIVFVAHCNLFHRITPQERRMYTIGYGVAAVLNFVLQLLFRRSFLWPVVNISQAQWPLLVVEFLLLMIAVAAIFYRPRPLQQTAQQALDQNINQMATPFGILRGMWPLNRLFLQRPPQGYAAPDEDDLMNPGPRGNPDPGAP